MKPYQSGFFEIYFASNRFLRKDLSFMSKVLQILHTRSLSNSCILLAKKKELNIQKAKFLGRTSNNLSAGIVGLANVGKSTFFQAITNSKLGTAANYPYATIDPEDALVLVKDHKTAYLQKLFESQKAIPSSLKVVDIAGLTRNAASGVGLGNKFLSDIRQVDGIFQVVRGFIDDEIIHIEENIVNPVRDLEIVTEELILKDIEFVESALETTKKALKKPNVNIKEVNSIITVLEKVETILYESKKICSVDWTDNEIDVLNQFNFLTSKPSVYLLNVSEEDYLNKNNKFLPEVRKWIDATCPKDNLVLFSAAYERALTEETNDKETSAFNHIIQSMRDALSLISFYTCGPQETRQWTLRKGSTVLEAAAVIHTDLSKTFISSQVYKYSDLEKLSPPFNLNSLKNDGKILKCGKNYIVEDGDVILIKAGAAKVR